MRRLAVIAVVFAVTLGLYSAADAETVQANAPITREAYWSYPITQTTPALVRNGFPPATACLVAGLVGVPQICGSETQQVAALLGLTDGLPIPITPDSELAQPTALPGTTPVGMAGGQTRYVSAAAFNVPALGDGERYSKFELVLSEDGFNFAIESPATRELVLRLVRQLQDGEPQEVADAITRALTGEVPLAAETITGIEACPITDPWNAGRGQSASLDGSRVPRTDCLAGTTGVYDAEKGTWTFDLTFAVQAWTEGDADGDVLANQGIMFRPLGAPNFAYGDPDFSVNWVVSLADSTNADESLRPRMRYTTVVDESDALIDTGDFDVPDLVLGNELDNFDTDLGDVGTLTPSRGGSGAGSGGDGIGRTPRTIASHASTPGWLWFLLPFALIAVYMFDQALNATPAALRRRAGALTHLEMNREHT